MKIALLIIYNHRYDKNIPIIEEIYKKRFTHIYHIVPFYDGNMPNVISVFENSYQFEGYISQAYQHIKNEGFSNYFIVADDMAINPKINESNIFDITGICPDNAFVPELIDLSKRDGYWSHAIDAYNYNPTCSGVEIKSILPPQKLAESIFESYGINGTKVNRKCILNPNQLHPHKSLKQKVKNCLLNINKKNNNLEEKEYLLHYPLIGGYSDILMLPSFIMDLFCQYCGAFAASRLFVEFAIPTSLVLTKVRVQTLKDIKLNEQLLEWSTNYKEFLNQFQFNYINLINGFPSRCFYIHPKKLSKWLY